ncbi:MAG: adenylate/guanylate cyclase domain-containing protein, partial [Candidatus Binatia bacterium]
ANLVETLLGDDPITLFPGWAHAFVFIVLCALTIWTSIRLKPLKALAVVVVLAAGYVFTCIFSFFEYLAWLPQTPPLFAIALSYGGLTLNNYIREQRERIRTRAFLNKYVSSDVADELLEDHEGLGLSGKRRHVTVLFSDLRGFTGISEQISPEQAVSLLAEYLSQVTQIIFKHGGTVDKFMGDGVMAIFGAPKSHGDDALRAVKTGLEMIEMVEARGKRWIEIIGKPLKVGVGINTGDAVVGSIGSEIRSDFTAIGDTVNLASRLEGLTKELGVPILVSESTVAEMKDSISLKPLRRVKVTGRETPLLVYTSPTVSQGEGDSDADEGEPYTQRHK